jgi:hypothetical protein
MSGGGKNGTSQRGMGCLCLLNKGGSLSLCVNTSFQFCCVLSSLLSTDQT